MGPGAVLVPPLKIEVFPEDLSATEPFFTANIQPINWLPSFPCSLAAVRYIGMDTRIVQPPLPEGPSPELCGTDTWKRSNPIMYGRKTRVVWIDMKQPPSQLKPASESTGEDNALLERSPKEENWWPGLRRWHLGLWFEDAHLNFGEAEILAV